MALQVITPPTGGLITLAQAKAQCRVDHTDDDTLLDGLILAAGDLIEDFTQRKYLAQSLNWIRECWADPMRLPVAPCGDSQNIAIGDITYGALDGTTQILDPALYWQRPNGPTLEIVRRWFVIWPWLGDAAQRVIIPITITPPTTGVPVRVRQAAALLVSHWFEHRDAVVGVENRDSSTPMPLGVESLLVGECWS